VYEVIADPFDAGSVHETEIFGASGAFAGIIADVASEGADVTAALLAVELVIALNV
jgi:predicted dinucleotide-utilizing enzyme